METPQKKFQMKKFAPNVVAPIDRVQNCLPLGDLSNLIEQFIFRTQTQAAHKNHQTFHFL